MKDREPPVGVLRDAFVRRSILAKLASAWGGRIIAESTVVYTSHLMLGNSRQGRSGWGRRLLYPAIALAAGGLVGYFSERPQEVEAGARNLVSELIRTSDQPPPAGFSIEGTARAAIAALVPPREIDAIEVISNHAGHLATVVVAGAAGATSPSELVPGPPGTPAAEGPSGGPEPCDGRWNSMQAFLQIHPLGAPGGDQPDRDLEHRGL